MADMLDYAPTAVQRIEMLGYMLDLEKSAYHILKLSAIIKTWDYK